MNKKDTIFITIERGMVVRNFLLNNFFEKIKEKYNVVIFTPLNEDKDFILRFKQDGVFFEKLLKHKLSRLENIFIAVHKALIYNPTVEIKSKYGYSLKMKKEKNFKKLFVNYFEYFVFGKILSKIKILRNWLKKIDSFVFYESYYKELFDKYRPIAVFVTNIIWTDEIYLLREAKKRNIKNFGMTKSWDNFSKIGFRDKVDNLIVWSEFMKDEAIEFQNYKDREISVIGIPQFDIYAQIKTKYSREDFIKMYNLDESKKVILFGQESPQLSPDDPYIVEIIKKWIEDNNKPYQVLIRPHYAHPGAISVFKELVDNKTVFIDLIHKPSKFRDMWDISRDGQLRLALGMRFSDVIVTSISTLILDGLASGNNIVSYSFDKDKNKEFGDSIKRLFETLWFVELKKYGLRKFMAENEEEMFKRIEDILQVEFNKGEDEKRKILDRFCYKVDGQSGERLFTIINNNIQNET